MARRGDALYLRGKTWYLDCCINGTRYQRRLGKGITRSVAPELAQIQRAAILKGELGIGKKAKDLNFDEARKKFAAWAEASKKPGTAKSYKECLRRLAESFSGKLLGELSPFLVEKHKQARIQAGARVRANRELAVLKNERAGSGSSGSRRRWWNDPGPAPGWPRPRGAYPRVSARGCGAHRTPGRALRTATRSGLDSGETGARNGRRRPSRTPPGTRHRKAVGWWAGRRDRRAAPGGASRAGCAR